MDQLQLKRIEHFVIGIDPGLDGALAVITQSSRFIATHPVPTHNLKRPSGIKREYSLADLASAFLPYLKSEKPVHIFAEITHAMPGQGVSSMFSMGRGVGIMDGIVAAFQTLYPLVTYERVGVASWKRHMMKSPQERASKAASIARARELWPALHLKASEHGQAEALLIAEFGRRLRAGRTTAA